MREAKYQLVLVRHGHTKWNLTNRFTGWTDVPLSSTGIEEASQAGLRFKEKGFAFDEAHISVLFRTRQALNAMLDSASHPEIPVYTSWRLNERHYGNLQGMNKQAIFDAWGEEQAYRWWRGYEAKPPLLKKDDPRHPRFDPLYDELDPAELPDSESLSQCLSRLLPYWHETLLPAIKAGRRLIIVSHGNTLRALRMYIEKIDPQNIEKIEIPLGTPFVYSLDEKMKPIEIDWLEQIPVV